MRIGACELVFGGEKSIKVAVTLNDKCDMLYKPYERGNIVEYLKIMNS